MVGRAGRRGMDEAGFAYLRVNPWEVDFSSLRHLLEGRPEQVSSRFATTYATLLNLYRNYGDNLLPFYLKTFHAFQTPPARHREEFASVDRRLSLLKDSGYTEPGAAPNRGNLTHKGAFAATLYGYELLLSELFEEGTLDKLNATDLGVLLLAMVYEPRRGMGPPPKLPRRFGHLMQTSMDLLAGIHKEERRRQVSPLSKQPCFHLAEALERWLQGGNFDKVAEQARADEGELARYFRMTIQMARTLHLASEAGAGLKQKAGDLIQRINRDPVDAEAELRRSL